MKSRRSQTGPAPKPAGSPTLTAPDNRFDWSTKAIYAIFDYVGVGDGVEWQAVWTRNGLEVGREEHLWNVETDGTEGRRWAVYYDEGRPVLPSGNYNVTLYIDGNPQSTADFDILY